MAEIIEFISDDAHLETIIFNVSNPYVITNQTLVLTPTLSDGQVVFGFSFQLFAKTAYDARPLGTAEVSADNKTYTLNVADSEILRPDRLNARLLVTSLDHPSLSRELSIVSL